MSARRFTEKLDLDPTAVRSLPDNHRAMMDNRTLFPSTVVTTDENFTDRLLVSGKNNRKLGERIEKGKFKGYALFGLSLEERATCPSDCSVRGACYGNGMQMARRHRIDPEGLFYSYLEDEIRTILADEAVGLLVRLHVLGDFPSVEYVAFWADLLSDHPRLAVYGYTHRRAKSWGGDDVGEAIQNVKDQYPDRFRIRWSSSTPRPDGATVIKTIPNRPRVDEGLVCPAQTDATACCATCGLCWEPSARNETIAFIKHGPKSGEVAALAAMQPATSRQTEAGAAHKERLARIASGAVTQKPEAPKAKPLVDVVAPKASPSHVVTPIPWHRKPAPIPTDCRQVQPIELPSYVRTTPISVDLPEVRHVTPTDLLIEPRYQRDLSGKSMRLIKQIIHGWDWSKYKPPVCAQTDRGLFVIDGQHTAIAAASHPGIKAIPVMVVDAGSLEKQASAFVAHNRDRLVMSPFQLFHAEVTAGDREACGVLAACKRAGASIPRSQPMKLYAKVGDIVPVGEVRRIFRIDGVESLEQILRIAVAAKQAPIQRVVLRTIRMIVKDPHFSNLKAKGERSLAAALASIENVDVVARLSAAETGNAIDHACALLIAAAVEKESVAA